MLLSARPPPITTYNKTTNIYILVTFCTNSWRCPWGRRCTFNTFWSSDDPLFCHPRRGGLCRFDSLWLAGVSHAPTCWDVGSTRLRAVPGLPLRKPRLHPPTGSVYYTSARRHSFWHPSEGHPPSALGRTTTSTTRDLRFIPSKLSAQTPP